MPAGNKSGAHNHAMLFVATLPVLIMHTRPLYLSSPCTPRCCDQGCLCLHGHPLQLQHMHTTSQTPACICHEPQHSRTLLTDNLATSCSAHRVYDSGMGVVMIFSQLPAASCSTRTLSSMCVLLSTRMSEMARS